MSEMTLASARDEVQKSVSEFEKALDHLLHEIEQGTQLTSELGTKMSSKMKEQIQGGFEDILDNSVAQARVSAENLFSDLRQSAERQLEKMDERPLLTWGAVLLSGLTAGFILARALEGRAKPG